VSCIKLVCWWEQGETGEWSLTKPRDIEGPARFWDITQRRAVIVYGTFRDNLSVPSSRVKLLSLTVRYVTFLKNANPISIAAEA